MWCRDIFDKRYLDIFMSENKGKKQYGEFEVPFSISIMRILYVYVFVGLTVCHLQFNLITKELYCWKYLMAYFIVVV